MAGSRKSLDGSWVLNDEGDGDVSWKDDASSFSASEPEPSPRPVQKQFPPRKAATRKSKSPEPSTNFIFPTVESPGKQVPSRSAPSPRVRQRMTAKSLPKMTQRIKQPVSKVHANPASTVWDTTLNVVFSILDYIFTILKSTLLLLRQPIAYILGLYLFFGIITISYNLLTSSISTALSPICRLPLASYIIPLCTYTTSPSSPSLPTIGTSEPEFEALMSSHDHLSSILSSTSQNTHLPISMKNSETSIRDLRSIVRYSSLPTRNELVLEFDGFIETARTASYDLQKFNSHVGRTIDVTLSTARWTERVLDDMTLQTTSTQIGYIPSLLTSLLSPFQPIPFTQTRLLETYITHTRIISDNIADLITEAQALLHVLQNLEDRLDIIHDISLRTQQDAQLSKDEILGHLWTLLGGNKSQLSKYNKQLVLLRQVGEYRKIAFAHVSATLLKLQGMQAELEELRERVGSAEAEASVRRPSERTPLSVHIEAIRLGIERLETERERGRELEGKHIKRVLGEVGRDDKYFVGGGKDGRREIGS